MKHARDDYSHIQDHTGKIPEDEPVFLLRGQDTHAPAVVRLWARLAENGGASAEIVDSAYAQAVAMDAWQREVAVKKPNL